MKKIFTILFLFFFFSSIYGEEKEKLNLVIEVGKIKGEFAPIQNVVSDVALALRIQIQRDGKTDTSFHDALQIEGELYSLNSQGLLVRKGSTGTFNQGICLLKDVYIEGKITFYYHNQKIGEWSPPGGYVIPGILTILPPLLAIVLAFWLKEVILALMAGIWLGATFLCRNPVVGLMNALDTYIINSIADADHARIIFFSLMLGGMVGIIVRNGSMYSMVNHWAKYIQSRRSAQLSTWGMGMVIFFDDYANTLMVGQTMRPLTDRLKVSREKLAYLVDSTAAPVAGIAIISTWIGVELGYLQTYLKVQPSFMNSTPDAFHAFIMMLPYRFYSIFTLLLAFLIALTLRDYGPMWNAEKRAFISGEVIRKDANPLQSLEEDKLTTKTDLSIAWYHGLIPILLTIVAIFIGLYYDGQSSAPEGSNKAFWEIIGNANSLKVLCWASTLGVLVATLQTAFLKIMKLPEILQAWLAGVRSMTLAIIILVLAWTLGEICKSSLHTGEYIVEITRGLLPGWALPAIVFIVASIVSFSTGTSWGTMAILLPIVIPMATTLLMQEGHISSKMVATDYGWSLLLASIAGVLAGATFGDHCSPISDTTVMSSMASACDHIDHVRTQLPYSLTAAFVSLLLGYIPIGLGLNVWISLGLGMIALVAIVFFVGKTIPSVGQSMENEPSSEKGKA